MQSTIYLVNVSAHHSQLAAQLLANCRHGLEPHAAHLDPPQCLHRSHGVDFRFAQPPVVARLAEQQCGPLVAHDSLLFRWLPDVPAAPVLPRLLPHILQAAVGAGLGLQGGPAHSMRPAPAFCQRSVQASSTSVKSANGSCISAALQRHVLTALLRAKCRRIVRHLAATAWLLGCVHEGSLS